MEITVYDDKGLEAPLIHDIIGKNINEGDNLMLNYLDNSVAILYTSIKDSIALKLMKKELIEEPIDFFEYKTSSSKKGYVNILARINIQNIFDLLSPYSQRQLLKYRDDCLKNGITFNTEKELILAYMKTHNLQILRYCEPCNSYLSTSYLIKYRVIDKKCILSCESDT